MTAFAPQHIVEAVSKDNDTTKSVRNFLEGCSWQARDGLRVYCQATKETRDLPNPEEAVFLFLASYWLEIYQFQLHGLSDVEGLARVNTSTLMTISPPDIFQTARKFNAEGWLVRQQQQLDLKRMTGARPTTTDFVANRRRR